MASEPDSEEDPETDAGAFFERAFDSDAFCTVSLPFVLDLFEVEGGFDEPAEVLADVRLGGLNGSRPLF